MTENPFLTNQANQAANNPTIISPLTTPSNVNTTLTSPPTNPNSVSTPNYYQQAGQMAQEFSGNLFGTGYVSGGEKANEQLLQQLFQYDQMLEKKYSPFPQVPGYVENPADLYSAGANFAAGVGPLSSSQGSAISSTESAYNAAISGLLDKFVQFAQMKEDREERQKEREYQDKKDQRDFLFKIKSLTGGSFRDPVTGEMVTVPGPSGAEGPGRSIVDILGLRQSGGMSKAPAKGPQYTPARAGITETVNGQTFTSTGTGTWEAVGGASEDGTDMGMEVDRNQILAALMSTNNPKEVSRLTALLGELPESPGVIDSDTRIAANQLRDEYRKDTENYIDVRDAYNKITKAGDKGGVGDINVIVSFAKLIDPGSVVRESEFKNVSEAGSWLSQAYNIPVKLTVGNKLHPETRKLFLDEATRLYDAYNQQHQRTISEYTRVAQQMGIDPSLVVIDYSPGSVSSAGSTVKMQSPDGRTYMVDESEVVTAEANGWRRL